MTLSSKTQKVLTSPLFILPTIAVAVSVAWLVNLMRKNRVLGGTAPGEVGMPDSRPRS